MRDPGDRGGAPRAALATAVLIAGDDRRHGLAALMAAGAVTKPLPATSLWARGTVIRRVHDLFGGSTGLTGFAARGHGEEALLRALARLDIRGPSPGCRTARPSGLAARAQGRLDGLWTSARRSLVLGAASPALLRRDGVPGVGAMAASELWPAFDVAWGRATRLESTVHRLAEGPQQCVAGVEWLGAALDDLDRHGERGTPADRAVRDAVRRAMPPSPHGPALAAVVRLCFAGASAGMVWDAMERGCDDVAAEWAPTLLALAAMEDAGAP